MEICSYLTHLIVANSDTVSQHLRESNNPICIMLVRFAFAVTIGPTINLVIGGASCQHVFLGKT
jgi:hypothetical protein